MNKLVPRPLDHLVLPVPDLDTARRRWSKLGFTVGDDARHTFGSENACIYFENGTYLEPLAIGHRETVEAAIRKGNAFLRRDNGFRFRNGNDGFSLCAFSGSNAKKDKKQFKEAGYRPGGLITVKRPGLKVRAVVGEDERSPDFALFRCERENLPLAFDASKTSHANGAFGISRVVIYEDEPSDFQYYIQTISGVREIRSHSFGLEFQLPNATLSVFNESGIKAHYDTKRFPAGRGLHGFGFEVEVSDLEKTKSALSSNNMSYREYNGRLIIDQATGQGALVAFVETGET